MAQNQGKASVPEKSFSKKFIHQQIHQFNSDIIIIAPWNMWNEWVPVHLNLLKINIGRQTILIRYWR